MESKSQAGTRVTISTAELERRWQAVRKAMQAKRLDFLIFQNAIHTLNGYVKWFTDISVGADGYPATVIFPRDEDMTTIWHGPRPPDEPAPSASSVRGVKKRLSVPIIHSLGYSSIFDAEKAVEELARYKNCRIGLVGMGFISAAFYKYVTDHLDTAKFEDATDLVENIKVIKSEEEIGLIRQTCAIQDALFEYTLTCLKPGKTDQQVRAEVVHKALDLGVQVVSNMRAGSAPAGKPMVKTGLPRVLQDGDQFSISLETDGPSGLWAEMSRPICLGRSFPEAEEQQEVAKEAMKVTLALLKPGTDPMTIWDANNEFMRRRGYPEERRIFAHGQGYDMVERPSLNPGETIKIQPGMNIAVHPTIRTDKAKGAAGGNYLVTESGKLEVLHKTPQKVFVA